VVIRVSVMHGPPYDHYGLVSAPTLHRRLVIDLGCLTYMSAIVFGLKQFSTSEEGDLVRKFFSLPIRSRTDNFNQFLSWTCVTLGMHHQGIPTPSSGPWPAKCSLWEGQTLGMFDVIEWPGPALNQLDQHILRTHLNSFTDDK